MPEPKSTTVKSRISKTSERLSVRLNVSKILVSIDFTRRSEQTIAYGLQLARFWTAKILFLHVLPRVDERQAAAFELNAKGTLREGIPQEEVIRVAASMKPNLIVLGSHGHKILRRLVLGSTAEHVVRHAPCPVLIVRPSAQAKDS